MSLIVIALAQALETPPNTPSSDARPSPLEQQARRHLAAGHQLVFIVGQNQLPEALADDPSCQKLAVASLADLPDNLRPDWCEFWGNQAGFFTADLDIVRAARLLLEIDYNQAQELCRLGKSEIHPSQLARLAPLGLSLLVRSAHESLLPGTWIRPQSKASAEVSAVVCQSGLDLISIDSDTMWQQAGFLAEAFGVFARHRQSVDMVATSQTNLSVSLDGPPANSPEAKAALAALLEDLPGEVHLIPDCAAVTLVGRRIRTLIPKLGNALELFDEQKIHLMTQSSSDVSLSFVVDAEQAPRLVKELHQLLFSQADEPLRLGPALAEVRAGKREGSTQETWWTHDRERLLEIAAECSPVYVYDERTVVERLERLSSLKAVDRLLFAIKANNHPDILRTLWTHGVGLECVSEGEIEHALKITGTPLRPHGILFTPNFASLTEYEMAFAKGATVTLDSLAPLQDRPEIFAGREVFLRLDSGLGDGHHKHVRTGGNASKFGISLQEFDVLLALVKRHDIRVTGLHCHQGSGIMNPDNWAQVANFLKRTAERFFPEVRTLDLGGGLGVPERRGKDRLNLAEVEQSLNQFKSENPSYQLWLEPGRFLVAECGVLLATVTQVKQRGNKTFVGLSTGFNSLIRPALYGAYHEIVNLTRLNEAPRLKVDIVGPICETGDVLGRDRWLPPTQPGDICLIGTAGAYGRVMSNNYNLRPPADERFIQSRTRESVISAPAPAPVQKPGQPEISDRAIGG